jgi:hypothetical protein
MKQKQNIIGVIAVAALVVSLVNFFRGPGDIVEKNDKLREGDKPGRNLISKEEGSAPVVKGEQVETSIVEPEPPRNNPEDQALNSRVTSQSNIIYSSDVAKSDLNDKGDLPFRWSDSEISNKITIKEEGRVEWDALRDYPRSCGSGQVVRGVGDSLECVDIAASSYWEGGSVAYPKSSSSDFAIGGSNSSAPLFFDTSLKRLYAISMRIGEGDNYVSIDDSGFLQLHGEAAVWDDLMVPVSSTTEAGSNPPTFALMKDSGVGGADSAVYFNGVSNPVVVSDDSDFDFADDFTIEFWVKPDIDVPNYAGMLEKSGEYRIRRRTGGDIEVRLSTSGGNKTIRENVLNLGQKNHVVLAVDVDGGDTNINFYVNSVLHESRTYVGVTPSATSNDLYIGSRHNGASKFKGAFDEVRFYDRALSASDVDDHYNDGAGEVGDEDESGLRTGYHFNDDLDDYEVGGSGSNDNDGSVVGGATYVTGLVGNGVTRGVYTWFFEEDSTEELHFTLQIPHAWKIGTNLRPHLHFIPSDDSAGDVVWGLEYAVTDVDGVFGNTTIMTNANTIESGSSFNHSIGTFGGEIDMSAYDQDGDVSTMIIGRVFRSGTDSEDTYDALVGLLEIDFHYQIDSFGSFEEYSK